MSKVSFVAAVVVTTVALSVAHARGPWGPGPYSVQKQGAGAWIITKDGGSRPAVGDVYRSPEAADAAARDANRRFVEQMERVPKVKGR